MLDQLLLGHVAEAGDPAADRIPAAVAPVGVRGDQLVVGVQPLDRPGVLGPFLQHGDPPGLHPRGHRLRRQGDPGGPGADDEEVVRRGGGVHGAPGYESG